MAKGIPGKNYWALVILILAGIVIGGFIGELTSGVSGLSWLGYGQTFGLTIKITIAVILGILIAILIYHFI